MSRVNSSIAVNVRQTKTCISFNIIYWSNVIYKRLPERKESMIKDSKY